MSNYEIKVYELDEILEPSNRVVHSEIGEHRAESYFHVSSRLQFTLEIMFHIFVLFPFRFLFSSSIPYTSLSLSPSLSLSLSLSPSLLFRLHRLRLKEFHRWKKKVKKGKQQGNLSKK
jgi:hypothetical protein